MFFLAAGASDWRWPLSRLWPPSAGGWGGVGALESPPKVPVGGRLLRMQRSRNQPGWLRALKKKKKSCRFLRRAEDVTVSMTSLNNYRQFSSPPGWTRACASAVCSLRGAKTSRHSQLADAFPAALTRITSYYVRQILSHVLLMEPEWPSALTARFVFFFFPRRRCRRLTLGAFAFHFGLRREIIKRIRVKYREPN